MSVTQRSLGIRTSAAPRDLNGRIFLGQALETTSGAQPSTWRCAARREARGQGASAVEVTEERLPDAALLGQSVQVRIQRIGELAGVSGGIDRISRSIENGAKREHEVVPRPVVSGCARARKRQVFEVKRFEILAQLR